jgi:hypothetical protein
MFLNSPFLRWILGTVERVKDGDNPETNAGFPVWENGNGSGSNIRLGRGTREEEGS